MAYFYTPSTTSTPPPEWRPELTGAWKAFGHFVVTGTQLNGLTDGGDMGDDARMATNYPIAYLTTDPEGTGAAIFPRSFNFDQMAPRRSTLGAFSFTDVLGRNFGVWYVHVAASGLASSNSVPFEFREGDGGWGYVPVLASAL